ncbi:MAG: YqgE/AlgH family protein [Alphaproteobacteria bacterium]|nr:YqgE/AlgH family protein [Alphaproteobacteria bacterium]
MTLFRALALLLLLLPASPAAAADAKTRLYLAGQMLVAAPSIKDPRFQKSVIFMIGHDAAGAFGLIVNRPVGSGTLKNFLKGLGMEGGDKGGPLALHYGGPVEGELGFVLHTDDVLGAESRAVAGGYAWSPAPEVLQAASEGRGPRRLLFALGYSGWGPGQLEGEIERGDWLIAPADEAAIFEIKNDDAWDKARAGAAVRL